jgi:hypothetical protein
MTAADTAAADVHEDGQPADGQPDGAQLSPECAGPEPPALFTFTPEGPEFGPPQGIPPVRTQVDYGGPIVVPRTSAIVTPGTERWFFRKLNVVQKRIEKTKGSPLELAFFWLEHAGVDDAVIDRIALLSVDEWERFYRFWMSGAADSNLGE